MQLKNKLKQNLDDTEFSPVVGIILMVAITVILSVVLTGFALGLGNHIQSSATADISFNENTGNEITIILNSVQNADSIYVESTVNVADSAWSGGVDSSDLDGVQNTQVLLNGDSGGTGTTVTLETSNLTEDGTIQVIGVLSGNKNVIQDQEYAGGA